MSETRSPAKKNAGQDLMNTNGSVDFMISLQKGNLQCKVCLAFSSLLGELYILNISVKLFFYDQFWSPNMYNEPIANVFMKV